jgi:phage shock protein PspC (stress-responsive transcriptional regulator)
MEKKLYRDQQNKVIGGVCAGLAEYFDIDVSIVRVLFLASLILKGGGFLLYIVLMIVLPKKNYIFNDPTVDYKVPPDPMGYKVNDPFVNKRRSNGNIIAGTILIAIGAIFLLNQLDFIPYINFHLTWPILMIAGGLVILFSRKEKQPWKDTDWKATPKQDAPKTDEPLNDNPPTE